MFYSRHGIRRALRANRGPSGDLLIDRATPIAMLCDSFDKFRAPFADAASWRSVLVFDRTTGIPITQSQQPTHRVRFVFYDLRENHHNSPLKKLRVQPSCLRTRNMRDLNAVFFGAGERLFRYARCRARRPGAPVNYLSPKKPAMKRTTTITPMI